MRAEEELGDDVDNENIADSGRNMSENNHPLNAHSGSERRGALPVVLATEQDLPRFKTLKKLKVDDLIKMAMDLGINS